MADKMNKTGGGGVRTGLRTSARTKKLKDRILRKVREGTSLSNREARKWKGMQRSRKGVELSQLAASGKADSPKPSDFLHTPAVISGAQAALARGFKTDVNGKWRTDKGHFVKKDVLTALGI